MKIHIKKAQLFNQQDVLVSTSAPRKANEKQQNTLAALLPVHLDWKQNQEFIHGFHPQDHSGAPQTFYRQARFMVEVSAYVNAVYEGLRYGMTIVESYENRIPELGELITREIKHAYESMPDLDSATRNFMLNMSSGRHHIVRDSERFKGGKDILYLGMYATTGTPLAHCGRAPNTSTIPPVQTDSPIYDRWKSSYDTRVGKALITTGWWIQKILLGDQSAQLKSAYARIYHQHPVTLAPWDFIKKLTSLFMTGPLAKAGVPVVLPEFHTVPTVIQETEENQLNKDGTKRKVKLHKYQGMQEYVSLVAVREPQRHAIDAKVMYPDKPDESLNISLEALALNPNIYFTFGVGVPKEFCEFITQTKGDQIPLISMNTWATVWSASMMKPPKMKGGVKPNKAARYVIQPSHANELVKRRKELGLYSEPGRVNEDGLMITEKGDLNFMPTVEDSDMTNAKNYEKLLEEAIKLSFDAGTPLASYQGSAGAVFDIASPEYRQRVTAIKSELAKYKGSLQAFSWDINSVITVNATDPGRLASTKMVGANRPDSLNLATYMRSTFAQGMFDMFSRTGDTRTAGSRESIKSNHFEVAADGIVHSTIFRNFAAFYTHFAQLGKVPSFAELVKKAAVALNITSLEDEAVKPFEASFSKPGQSIYGKNIGMDLSVSPETTDGVSVVAVLAQAIHDASGVMRTNLARECIKESLDPIDHDRYFDGKTSTVGELSNVFAYLGGQVFHQAAKAMLAIPRKELTALEGIEEGGHLQFAHLQTEVMPLCVMFGKYAVPEVREKLYKEADEIIEQNSNPTASEDQLNLAGSRGPNADGEGGFKLFPHQAEALTLLKNHPKIAVLDIAPGGGKTTIGISDIAMLYADGLIKRPYVICPNRLVANWIEDCHKSFAGWNTIPVTTETYGEWGDERLTELLMKAPPNTIVIIGNSFLSNLGRTQLVIGNAVESTSNSVEFLKKFEPDYILIDESHRIKNTASAIHRGVKTINQMSSVKYGRIATGTLIQNVLSDVVGQAAIYNGQIFRSVDEFDAKHKGPIQAPDGSFMLGYKEDTAKIARDQLSKFCTVISYKRKEWAFMLPAPIETFIPVQFESSPEDDLGHKLRMFYEAVLRKTLEDAKRDKALAEANAKIAKGGDDEDEDDEDEQDAKRKKAIKGGADDDDDVEDDNSDALEAALQPYLQRLERILTDPFGDEDLLPVALEIFGHDVDRDSYVAPKVAAVIKRIKYHFTEIPWQKGANYKSAQMCDFNGKSYIFKPDIAAGTGEEQSNISPDVDTERWKEQVRGKIFITCRYTRSVDAIYRALPPDLKKMAVRFHGDVDSKDDNLNRFKKDPRVKILIANEQGISEGHNLQMASRFIRVEAPWAPGELDQTMSRIFRPDVGGEYIRQTIFMDWVICDDTLEVAKMGRLISKMLKKTQFDELHNPKYFKELRTKNLPVIKMSLDNFSKYSSMNTLCAVAGVGHSRDIHPESYLGQYRYMLQETGAEFLEMRKTKRAMMIPVTPTKMPDTAKILPFTPWVTNMRVEDKDDDGLVPLVGVLESETDELAVAFRKNVKALVGQYVRTEFGLGVVIKVTTKKGKSSDDADATEGKTELEAASVGGNEISKVFVKLAQGGEVRDLSAQKVYLARNITERTKNKLNKTAPKITDADKARTQRQRERGEQVLKDVQRQQRDSDRRRDQVIRPKVEPKVEPKQKTGIEVELYPIVFNEFLAIEAVEVEETGGKALKKFGFRHFGHFAKLPIPNVKNFIAALDWLEDKFTLDAKSVKHLNALADSFSSGKGRKFNIELAPVADLPRFFKMTHTPTVVRNKRKPELKVYPVLLSGKLMLVVDLATNPAFATKGGLTTTIPGMTGDKKFVKTPGSDLIFLPQKKSALIAKVKELMAAGLKVLNLKELKAEVAELNLKAIMTHNE